MKCNNSQELCIKLEAVNYQLHRTPP